MENKSRLTIAGQTAPGKGITIRDHAMVITKCSDIVVRYLRLRLGDKNKGDSAGEDVMTVDYCDQIILDHLSLSWGIDGNSDGFLVLFDHELHKKKMGERESCKVCHHARFPHDQDTGCYRCHMDMYSPMSIFNHDSHVTSLGGNRACDDCHPSESNRGKEGTKDCAECHKDDLDLAIPGAPILMKKWAAPGYTDALHGLCISCHKEVAERIGNSEHGTCLTCHRADILAGKEGDWTRRQAVLSNKWVITSRLLSPKVKLDRFLVDK